MEEKSLVVNFAGTPYGFTAQPIIGKSGEPLRFRVDLGGNPSIIEYRYETWQQISGNHIYTDIAIGMGYTIQKHFPEFFKKDNY